MTWRESVAAHNVSSALSKTSVLPTLSHPFETPAWRASRWRRHGAIGLDDGRAAEYGGMLETDEASGGLCKSDGYDGESEGLKALIHVHSALER